MLHSLLNQVNSGIPEGGLVPKSYYMSPQDFEKDQSPGPHLTDSSCYQSISLNKSQVIHSTKQMACYFNTGVTEFLTETQTNL